MLLPFVIPPVSLIVFQKAKKMRTFPYLFAYGSSTHPVDVSLCFSQKSLFPKPVFSPRSFPSMFPLPTKDVLKYYKNKLFF